MADDKMVAYGIRYITEIKVYDVTSLHLLDTFHHGIHQSGSTCALCFLHQVYLGPFKGTKLPTLILRGIRSHNMAPSSSIEWHILRYQVLESTNKTAADLINLSQASHGTVILASDQTAGRGQRGRGWQTAPGLDLTLSIVLEPPSLRAEEQFGISKMAALAVRDTVVANVPEGVRVKWPNDVLVDRRKISGILIECDVLGDRVRHVVVGVGVNVNSTEFPEELAATSLRLEVGMGTVTEAVIGTLLSAFERRYLQWMERDPQLDQDYRAALWSAGRWADMVLDGEAVSLRPIDVDGQGRLQVEHPDGRVAVHGLDRLRFARR